MIDLKELSLKYKMFKSFQERNKSVSKRAKSKPIQSVRKKKK